MKKDSLKLKWAMRPQEESCLSRVVIVKDFSGKRKAFKKGHFHVKIPDSEFKRIANEMPRGISIHDPAHIEVEIYPEVFGIFCVYTRQPDTSALLYSTETRPTWLKGVKYDANDKETANP
jgi:hypothetical protein